MTVSPVATSEPFMYASSLLCMAKMNVSRLNHCSYCILLGKIYIIIATATVCSTVTILCSNSNYTLKIIGWCSPPVFVDTRQLVITTLHLSIICGCYASTKFIILGTLYYMYIQETLYLVLQSNNLG